jgi:hypothetical protein
MGRGMRVLFSQTLLASPENGKPYACIISQAEIGRLLKQTPKTKSQLPNKTLNTRRYRNPKQILMQKPKLGYLLSLLCKERLKRELFCLLAVLN